MNDKTFGSPSNTRKIQISHILETSPTNATECNLKKVFSQQNINTNNKSVVGQIVRSAYRRDDFLSWECGCANSIDLFIFCKKLQEIL